MSESHDVCDLSKLSSRFRWVFCQLETLRHCLPPSVRHTLDELPETLDETYGRVLKEIKKPNRVHALRLLQCLVVAIRPLRVEELAEVLAVDFDDEEGIPKLNPNWRWGDEEQALLTSCSSLITIVEPNAESDPESDPESDAESDVEKDEARKLSRIVQFSHFSVKEYLTSDRLATSSGDISRYHIGLVPAHTILAQACMSVLLRSDDCVEESGVEYSSPLAEYAAEHWVVHAQDERVSSCLRRAMKYLFDVDKPYFDAWLELHDIDGDARGSAAYFFTPLKSSATPLYYAARCGFQDLVEHLVANDPEQVNAKGGHYLTPLVAALARGHFQTANFLYDNGAQPSIRGYAGRTPLHSAALHGDVKMVEILLKYKADIHTQSANGQTPLHFASRGFGAGGSDFASSPSNVARLLLEHGADVDAQANDDSTPLCLAADQYSPMVELICVLLEHGADVNARRMDGTTPLHLAAHQIIPTDESFRALRVLLEHGADVAAKNGSDCTAFQLARNHRIKRLLLEYGAK